MPAKSGRAAPKAIAPEARGVRFPAMTPWMTFVSDRETGAGVSTLILTSEADAGARAQHHRIVGAGHIAPGLPEVLEIRLQRPTGLELSRIADFQKSLVVVKNGQA